ncbi:preprotein translocase subunit SecY [bacterium]|nr:preprotein translocase subunit SecY [bacterium]
MTIFTTFINAWGHEDLRKRIMFIIYMFGVFVLGSHIPVPGTNPEALARIFDTGGGGGGVLGILDMMSGGSLKRVSIFALGIMPYINASIIFNLLVIVFPQLQELQKEGEAGRKKIGQWTKYLTVVLAIIQATGMMMIFSNPSGGGASILLNPSPFSYIFIILTLTAGTCFLMWLGELITEFGIGNGVSLIIFAGIIARLPISFVADLQTAVQNNEVVKVLVMFTVLFVGMIAFVVFMHLAERRVTIKYARPGRYATPTHFLPLRVNMAGVIPIIFAISVLLFPATVAGFMPSQGAQNWASAFTGSWYYYVTYFILTVLFTFFYTAVVFNPTEVADNLKKNGGYIPGIRPGKPTADYLSRILERLTFVGAIYLASVAVFPSVIIQMIGGLTSLNIIAGTSILIIVGVALDTVRELEARLTMMKYESALK